MILESYAEVTGDLRKRCLIGLVRTQGRLGQAQQRVRGKEIETYVQTALRRNLAVMGRRVEHSGASAVQRQLADAQLRSPSEKEPSQLTIPLVAPSISATAFESRPHSSRTLGLGYF